MKCEEVKNKLDIGFDTGTLNIVIQYLEFHIKTCIICRNYANKLNSLNLCLHITDSTIVPKSDLMMRIQSRVQETTVLPMTRPWTSRIYNPVLALLLVLIGLSTLIFTGVHNENLARLYEPSLIYTSFSSITQYLSDHVYLLFYSFLHALDNFWAVLNYYSTWQGPRIWVGVALSLILLIAINTWEWHKGGITNRRSF